MKVVKEIAPASLKNSIKAILPGWVLYILRPAYKKIGTIILYYRHTIIKKSHIKKRGILIPAPTYENDRYAVHRIFKYNYNLLPNEYLNKLESESGSIETVNPKTGFSIGYPAWNLLYYSILCSLPRNKREVVVLEVGTNIGSSTIIIAQALKDAGVDGYVRTVDINEKTTAIAKENITKAGLADRVEFHVQDSLEFLGNLVNEVDHIDFAFIDGNHSFDHVIKEFSIIYPRIIVCLGKVYLDNTLIGGVADALKFIKAVYGGNIIEFNNCSWYPPGNIIWQP
jgi:hypothetical protein